MVTCRRRFLAPMEWISQPFHYRVWEGSFGPGAEGELADLGLFKEASKRHCTIWGTLEVTLSPITTSDQRHKRRS